MTSSAQGRCDINPGAPQWSVFSPNSHAHDPIFRRWETTLQTTEASSRQEINLCWPQRWQIRQLQKMSHFLLRYTTTLRFKGGGGRTQKKISEKPPENKSALFSLTIETNSLFQQWKCWNQNASQATSWAIHLLITILCLVGLTSGFGCSPPLSLQPFCNDIHPYHLYRFLFQRWWQRKESFLSSQKQEHRWIQSVLLALGCVSSVHLNSCRCSSWVLQCQLHREGALPHLSCTVQ